MQNDDRLTPMESELELALGGLKPAGASVSRDRVMFHAGRASMRRQNRLWQAATGILAVVLLASVVSRPQPAGPAPRAETFAYQPTTAAPAASPSEPIDRAEVEAFRRYVRTRRAVLEHGIEAIPAAPTSRDGFDTTLSREDLDELLS